MQSSRRLEREAGRNLELLWLLGRLVPDHNTIADFRKDNGPGLREVCAHFIELCRQLGLLATPSVAIDGSKFKAVNNRDKNFTEFGDAEVTEQDVMALPGHRTPEAARIYVKRTETQRVTAARRRRAWIENNRNSEHSETESQNEAASDVSDEGLESH